MRPPQPQQLPPRTKQPLLQLLLSQFQFPLLTRTIQQQNPLQRNPTPPPTRLKQPQFAKTVSLMLRENALHALKEVLGMEKVALITPPSPQSMLLRSLLELLMEIHQKVRNSILLSRSQRTSLRVDQLQRLFPSFPSPRDNLKSLELSKTINKMREQNLRSSPVNPSQ